MLQSRCNAMCIASDDSETMKQHLERNGTMRQMTTKQIFINKFGVFWTASFLLAVVLDFKTTGQFAKHDALLIFIALCLWPSRLFIYGGPKLKAFAFMLGFVLVMLLKTSGWI